MGAGGGLFASSECDSSLGIICGALLLDPAPAPMYGFLPITLASVAATEPFTVTPFGSITLGRDRSRARSSRRGSTNAWATTTSRRS